jgi:hypothetical protein
MKTNIEITKFRFPVFKSYISVVVSNNIPNAIDFMEDKMPHKIHDPDTKKFTRAYMYAYEDELNKRKYLLFLRPSAKPGEIAHEVKHLINIMFKWHGYRLSIDNDELECYYLEDIVDRVHSAILRYKKKYSKPKKIISKKLDIPEETPIFAP